MRPMKPTEEEPFDPQAQVLDEITEWARNGEAEAMRERYGQPRQVAKPMSPLGEDDPLLPEEGVGGGMAGPDEEGFAPIPGVEPTEDGEAPPPEEAEPDEEELRALLASMGG